MPETTKGGDTSREQKNKSEAGREHYNKLYQRHEAENDLLRILKYGVDEEELDDCLEYCLEKGVNDSSPTYQKGQRRLALIRYLKKGLQRSIKNIEKSKERSNRRKEKKDYDEEKEAQKREEYRENLAEAISKVKASGVERYLEKELEDAYDVMEEAYAASPRFPRPVIGMSKTAMAEMRAYNHPSPMVHRVMAAMLLLLREDESKTMNWSYVQKQCHPATLNRRLTEFDEKTVDGGIKQRAEYLLSKMSLQKVRDSCPGAACFYSWTRDRVGGESDSEEDEEEEFKRYEKEEKETFKFLRDSEIQKKLKEIEERRKVLDQKRRHELRTEEEKLQEAIEYEMKIFYGTKKQSPRQKQQKAKQRKQPEQKESKANADKNDPSAKKKKPNTKESVQKNGQDKPGTTRNEKDNSSKTPSATERPKEE